eukprot:6185876-Pleurochrysis_carterae.AAC.1
MATQVLRPPFSVQTAAEKKLLVVICAHRTARGTWPGDGLWHDKVHHPCAPQCEKNLPRAGLFSGIQSHRPASHFAAVAHILVLALSRKFGSCHG